MATVDNKVVSLEFNNSRFTGNVQSTMNALDKLKEKLAFKDGTKGFDDIQRAANQVKVDNISHGIEGVSKGFIAMSAVAVAALAKVTMTATEAGGHILKAMTLTPVTDGLGEYEKKMNSIQTIMSNVDDAGFANQDEKLDAVNKQLEAMNRYSDQTIYNFGEMARNLGTFTAAGIDLDTSAKAIKGIANIAAISGSSSEQASTAMYQLSQALASGSLKLMDWNSVVNAGMGGEIMQKSLFETGKALGTLKNVPLDQTFKEWKDAGNTFRESLQDEWVTADVLTTTLGAASGDLSQIQLEAKGFTEEQAKAMVKLGENGVEAATKVKTATQLFQTVAEAMGSGWATSFELITGNFGEAKTLFTNLNTYIGGIVGKSADSRNKMLLQWKKFGGRDALLQGFIYAWEDVLSILKPVGQAFRSVFPKKTTKDLLLMTASFRDTFKNFKMGGGILIGIRVLFTGLFGAIKIGLKILTTLGKVVFKVLGYIGKFLNAFVIAGIGPFLDFIAAVKNLFSSLTAGAGGAAAGVMGSIGEKAVSLGTWLGNLVGNLSKVTEWLTGFTKSLEKSDKATGKAEKSTSRFAGIIAFFKSVLSGVGNFFSGLFSGVESFGGLLGKIGSGIGAFFSGLVDGASSVGDFVGKLGSAIISAFGAVGRGLVSLFSNIDWDTVIGTVAVGSGVLLTKRIRDFFDSIDIREMLKEIQKSFVGVLDSAKGALKSFSFSLKASALLKIAIAIGILALSLKLLASIDPIMLAAAGAAVASMFYALTKSFDAFTKMKLPENKALLALSGALLAMSVSILILAFAMKALAGLDNGDISAGIVTIGALMAGLAGSVKLMSKENDTVIKAALTLLAMAGAVYILTFAIARLASMDPMAAVVGAGAVAAVMATIGYALDQMDEKESAKKGLAVLLVAAGLNVFAKAVETFGTMDWEVLKRGFGVIVLIMAGLVAFFKALPQKMLLVATEILIIAVAMNIMAAAILAMGSISPETLIMGLIGIAGALGVMAIAAQVMNSAIVGAGAIVVMAIGLTLLAGAVATFGQMGADTIVRSLLGIAGALLVIAVAGAAMGAISPLLLAGGIAFTVLGTGMLLFGAGAWLAATAIVALAGTSAVGVATAIVALKALAKFIPVFITEFAKGLLDGFRTILKGIPALMGDLRKALTSILTLVFGVITDFIKKNAEHIVQAGFDILLALLHGIRDNIAEVTMTVAELVVNFVDGLADAIDKKAEELGEAGRRLAGSIITGIVKALVPKEILTAIGDIVSGMIQWFKDLLGIHSPSSVFMDLAGNIISGLVNGLTSGASAVYTFFQELPGKILSFFGNVLTWLVQTGRDILQGMKNGIMEKFEQIKTWVGKVGGRIKTALGDAIKLLVQSGRNFFQGLWNGIKEKWDQIYQWVKDKLGPLGGFIDKILGNASPSKITRRSGRFFIEGLRLGMEDNWGRLHSDTESNAKSLLSAVQDATKSANGLEFLDGMSPTIRPVLDLSMVEAKARTLGDILGAESLAADVSYTNAQQIATTSTRQAEEAAAKSTIGGGDTNLTFVQNNNSPKALSTGDIYRASKSQIAIARRELGLVS